MRNPEDRPNQQLGLLCADDKRKKRWNFRLPDPRLFRTVAFECSSSGNVKACLRRFERRVGFTMGSGLLGRCSICKLFSYRGSVVYLISR
jgi:hypothetical protein